MTTGSSSNSACASGLNKTVMCNKLIPANTRRVNSVSSRYELDDGYPAKRLAETGLLVFCLTTQVFFRDKPQ